MMVSLCEDKNTECEFGNRLFQTGIRNKRLLQN